MLKGQSEDYYCTFGNQDGPNWKVLMVKEILEEGRVTRWLSFHGKWWTLQERMESWVPKGWFSWKGIGLFQGSLLLKREARQAEVASIFTGTVTVKSSSVEAMGIRSPSSLAWTLLWDEGAGSLWQSSNKPSSYKYSCHGYHEGYYSILG